MTRRYLADLAERTIATYVESLLGLLIAGWADFGDVSEFLDLGTSAAVAAVPAALTVLKAGAARLRGDRESASMARTRLRAG